MSNPLIAKYEELYGKKEEPKKEEPKKVEFEGTAKLSQEQMDIVSKYLTDPKNYSTTSLTNVNPYPASAITAANPSPPTFKSSNLPPPTFKTLTSYDTHSGENYFLEVAEKVKNKDARVTSVGFNQERAGIFSTGMTTITFEVQVWDTP